MRHYTSTPIPLAFDVFFEFDGKTARRGWPIIFANRLGSSNYGDGWGLDPTEYVNYDQLPSTINVILKSSRAVAETTTDIFEIWNGEIRFENVPVVAAATRPAASQPTIVPSERP